MAKADRVVTLQCKKCGKAHAEARKASPLQLRFCSDCIPAPQSPATYRTIITEPTDLALKCEYERCGKMFRVARRDVGGQRSLMRRFCCMDHAWAAKREWRAKHRRKYDPAHPEPAPVKDYSRSNLVDVTPPAPELEPSTHVLPPVTRAQWMMLKEGHRMLMAEYHRQYRGASDANEPELRSQCEDAALMDANILNKAGWI